MVWVICAINLMAADKSCNYLQVKGELIDDSKETWIVDFSNYINSHPKFKEYNNLVQYVNNNECLYVK
jgi:hypothetical protein